LEEIRQAVGGKPLEIWFADEARGGQKNKIPRRWAKRGTRPAAPKDQRTQSAYIFGAICPAEGKGVGLVLPRCTTAGMPLHLAALSQAVAPGAQALVLVDRAGWHQSKRLVVPANITLLPLPAKAAELNPVENIWQDMRETWISNRIFASYGDILDPCCEAWNKLTDRPWLIMSIGLRDWAHRF
jgi:putative transposase